MSTAEPLSYEFTGVGTINVGIFLPNWVGDAVMATPTLRALRQHYGRAARITGIMRPHISEVLAGTHWLDDTLLWNRRAADASHRSRAVLRSMRQTRFDSIFLLTNSLSTAALAWLSGSAQRIGYVRYGRRWLLTERLEPPRVGKQLAPISALDYYLELAATVGADVSDKRPELGTVSQAEATVTAFWQKQGWQSSDRVVVLNTGGAYGAAKDWPAEHFAALAQRLVDAHQLKVAVICGPAERDNARRIVELADRTAVASLADETPSINLSKSVVRRAALLVSTDSGPRHFGSAYGVPTVAIFGPTDPRWSDNHHPQAIDVVHPVDCGPCAKRTCPMGHHRCMRDLTVGQVYRASLTLLEQSPLHRVA